MATKNPNLLTGLKAPETFTLSGRELQCYRAGEDMGKSRALTAAAQDLRTLKTHLSQQLTLARDRMAADGDKYPWSEQLPDLADGLELIAANMEQKASDHQRQGNLGMGQVASQQSAQAARWRPPLRAWGMLTLAMIVSTTVATVAASYAIRSGW